MCMDAPNIAAERAGEIRHIGKHARWDLGEHLLHGDITVLLHRDIAAGARRFQRLVDIGIGIVPKLLVPASSGMKERERAGVDRRSREESIDVKRSFPRHFGRKARIWQTFYF